MELAEPALDTVSPRVGHVHGLVGLDGTLGDQLLERRGWRLWAGGCGNHQEERARTDHLSHRHDASIRILLGMCEAATVRLMARIVGEAPITLGWLRDWAIRERLRLAL